MTTANTTATAQPTTIAELDMHSLDELLERSIAIETDEDYISIATLKDYAQEFDAALATVIPTLGYERVRQPLEGARSEPQKVLAPSFSSRIGTLVTVLMARSELKRIVQSIEG